MQNLNTLTLIAIILCWKLDREQKYIKIEKKNSRRLLRLKNQTRKLNFV